MNRTLGIAGLAAAFLIMAAAARPGPADAPYATLVIEGFAIRVQPSLLEDARAWEYVERSLRRDLAGIVAAVPRPAVDALRSSTPIWVSHEVSIGAPGEEPARGRGAVFHWSADWPEAHGLGPGRGPAVDIYNAGDYLEWRDHQPMMLLHELAHAYHVLLGAERPEIGAAYRSAIESGRYDSVRYGSAPGARPRKAYAATNEMEYFAELTEAYFGRNDFEPFTRDELRSFDPEGYAMVERLWKLDAAALRAARSGAGRR